MEAAIEDLIGKTLSEIKGTVGDSYLRFTTTDGESYLMYHEQDCCESVTVEDIVGELSDLIGSPILEAYEDSNVPTTDKDGADPDECTDEYYQWTFYRLGTINGRVCIRWYGVSNGCYSTSVNFVKMVNGEHDLDYYV